MNTARRGQNRVPHLPSLAEPLPESPPTLDGRLTRSADRRRSRRSAACCSGAPTVSACIVTGQSASFVCVMVACSHGRLNFYRAKKLFRVSHDPDFPLDSWCRRKADHIQGKDGSPGQVR